PSGLERLVDAEVWSHTSTACCSDNGGVNTILHLRPPVSEPWQHPLSALLFSRHVWPRPAVLRCQRDQARLLDPVAPRPRTSRRVGTRRQPTRCRSSVSIPRLASAAWT